MTEDAQLGNPPPPPRRSKTSIALITVGLLILIPSGLCTGTVGVGFLWNEILQVGFLGFTDMLGLVLMLGGVPIAIGAGLLFWGLRRPRR
jgi:hypothetical protein